MRLFLPQTSEGFQRRAPQLLYRHRGAQERLLGQEARDSPAAEDFPVGEWEEGEEEVGKLASSRPGLFESQSITISLIIVPGSLYPSKYCL